MKVIVAGLSKTGTKSMNLALTKLGYKVYDFPENVFLLTDEYHKIVIDGWTSEDFRRMYEDVDAVMDFPANFFWEEISTAFPDAKIVLTVRDDEEVWLRSFLKQMERTDVSALFRFMEILSPTFLKSLQWLTKLGPMCFGAQPQSRFRRRTVLSTAVLRKIYRSHNAYVQHCAPEGKLLMYKCSEGWGPLCTFLGVPVPDEPFPHKNQKGNIVDVATKDFPLFRKIKHEIIASTLVIITGAIASGFFVYKYSNFGNP